SPRTTIRRTAPLAAGCARRDLHDRRAGLLRGLRLAVQCIPSDQMRDYLFGSLAGGACVCAEGGTGKPVEGTRLRRCTIQAPTARPIPAQGYALGLWHKSTEGCKPDL